MKLRLKLGPDFMWVNGEGEIMTEDYGNKWISINDKPVTCPAWVQDTIGNVILAQSDYVCAVGCIEYWQPATIPKPIRASSWLQERLKKIPANDECGFWNGAREAIQEAMTKILDEFPFEGNGTKVGKMEFSSTKDARTSRIIDILREVIGE